MLMNIAMPIVLFNGHNVYLYTVLTRFHGISRKDIGIVGKEIEMSLD